MKPIVLSQPQRIVFGSGCISQFADEYLKLGLTPHILRRRTT